MSPMPSRRGFLASSVVLPLSLRAQTNPAIPPLPLNDWHPERLSQSVLSQAQHSFVRMANHAHNQQLVASDLTSAAHNLWSLHVHLHEVGFHHRAVAYMRRHHKQLTSLDPITLATHFERTRPADLQVPTETLANLYTAHVTDTKLHQVYRGANAGPNGVALIGRRGARALAYYASQLPASAASYRRLHDLDRLPLRVVTLAPADDLEIWEDCGAYGCANDQNEGYGASPSYIGDYYDSGGGDDPAYASPSMSGSSCWWLEAAGIYLFFLGIPLEAIPIVGQVISIAGIAMAITGWLFNC